MSLTILNVLLISTLILLLPIYWWMAKLHTFAIINTKTIVTKNWLVFLATLVILRATMGLLSSFDYFHLSVISYFYPIRIAYPNYHILFGIPYIFATIFIVIYLRQICAYIASKRSRYYLLWLFAITLSMFFGAIHGGLIDGNIGIANASDHLHDASLNSTLLEIFKTHADRVAGHIKPEYNAAHTVSHPSFSLAYWHVMVGSVHPFIFSLCNVLFFAVSFPILYWSLTRQFENINAIQATVACMITPALLIYGRADDAIYYGFATMIMAISAIAISEKRYWLTFCVGLLFALAMNFSYASLILLPALILFNANEPLNKCWHTLRVVTPHALLIILMVICIMSFMQHSLGYHYINEFIACAKHSAGNNIVDMYHHGLYGQILNARIMSVSDILLFGGPFFLYVLYTLLKGINSNIGSWPIKNIALAVCLVVLMIHSNGPGEQARPWGSLYLLISIPWFAGVLNQEDETTRWWLIRAQLFWALLLQIPLNFGW